MAEAKKDANGVPTMIGTSNADGETPINVAVDPSSHGVNMEDGMTGSDLSDDIASRDNNGETVLMGVSSSDGVTPTPIYVRSTNGNLLVDSS